MLHPLDFSIPSESRLLLRTKGTSSWEPNPHAAVEQNKPKHLAKAVHSAHQRLAENVYKAMRNRVPNRSASF